MLKKYCAYISALLLVFTLFTTTVSANTIETTAPQAANTISFSPQASKPLSVTAIDVGRGDALLVTFPNGRHMLIDAGTKYDADTFVLPYLKSHHITTLDAVVATHEHDDHLEGIVEVLKHTKVLRLYDSGFPLKKADGAIEKNNIDKYAGALKKISRKEIRGGMSLHVGSSVVSSKDVRIDVLSPHQSLIHKLLTKLHNPLSSHRVVNEGSVVLRLSYGTNRFVLMGDAGSIAAHDMTKLHGRSVRSDVLKVGHHGFAPADKELYGQVFTKKYNKIAIITYGPLHRTKMGVCEGWSKAVKLNLLKQGAKVYSSCKAGDITVTAYGSGNVLVHNIKQGVSKQNTCTGQKHHTCP